ncbi:MAG: hydroxymethylbilane synthase [Candidatus Tyrphobacter sp.]
MLRTADSALVVGGASVATRKAHALLSAGFAVRVVAPRILPELRALATDAAVTLCERAYERGDLGGVAVAVAATGDADVDAAVVADARERGVLVCDATQPLRGTFTMMATSRIGDVTIAVDSGASSPSFSRRTLDEIEVHLGARYGDAAKTLARIREELRTTMGRGDRIALLRKLSSLPIDELASAAAPRRVTCATRSSALATAQTKAVAALVATRGIATEMLAVQTAGDRDRNRPLHDLGEQNVFVKELEKALADRRADYAVHSAKDLPSELAAGFAIAAFCDREDPRDAFCSERYERFEDLPAGARVGTSSLRRRFQLQALRPDLVYVDVRGNVDTRLRKLREGTYDAIVLAMAGMRRLRVAATHTVPWPANAIVPAAGQGALALEVRDDDVLLAYDLRAAANDEEVELCVLCERAALRTLHAGCSAPIGVHARREGETMNAEIAYATPETIIRERADAAVRDRAQAQRLGERLGQAIALRVRPAESNA